MVTLTGSLWTRSLGRVQGRGCLVASVLTKQRPLTESEGPLTCSDPGGRYWDRTSDLFRVREARYRCANRPGLQRGFEVETGFEPVYTALQAVASPLGHSTIEKAGLLTPLRADDRVRTGDLNLGKVALYQLSYVRVATGFRTPRRETEH
jgi:hypothetical protein